MSNYKIDDYVYVTNVIPKELCKRTIKILEKINGKNINGITQMMEVEYQKKLRN